MVKTMLSEDLELQVYLRDTGHRGCTFNGLENEMISRTRKKKKNTVESFNKQNDKAYSEEASSRIPHV